MRTCLVGGTGYRATGNSADFLRPRTYAQTKSEKSTDHKIVKGDSEREIENVSLSIIKDTAN